MSDGDTGDTDGTDDDDDALGVDAAAMRAYLREELGAAPSVRFEALGDATLAVTWGEREYVLQRGDRVAPSAPAVEREPPLARDVAREHALLSALEPTAAPTPAPVLCCEDDAVPAAPFLLTERLPGATVPAGGRLPERFRTPAARRRIGRGLVDALATIRGVDAGPFDGTLATAGLDDVVERYVAVLDWATAATGRDLPGLRAAPPWLDANEPPAERRPDPAPVHGDFLPHNAVLAPGEPRVAGVVDWELGGVGDPLADLGFLLEFWREAGDEVPVDGLLSEYADHPHVDLLRRLRDDGLWRFTAEEGSPTRAALVERYERRTGTEVSDADRRFYRVLGAFRAGVLWEAWHRRRLEDGEREPPWEVSARFQALRCRRLVDGTGSSGEAGRPTF